MRPRRRPFSTPSNALEMSAVFNDVVLPLSLCFVAYITAPSIVASVAGRDEKHAAEDNMWCTLSGGIFIGMSTDGLCHIRNVLLTVDRIILPAVCRPAVIRVVQDLSLCSGSLHRSSIVSVPHMSPSSCSWRGEDEPHRRKSLISAWRIRDAARFVRVGWADPLQRRRCSSGRAWPGRWQTRTAEAGALSERQELWDTLGPMKTKYWFSLSAQDGSRAATNYFVAKQSK